jgi:type IV pilus assembly protein PilE
MKRYTGGFTLIEVMIVVVIISILAMIAYPSYKDSVNKTRRSDAKTALMNAAALEERHFSENNTYTDDETKVGGTTSPEGYYAIAATIPTTAGCGSDPYYCYLLTATATGAQLSSDTNCKTLSIDHTGATASTDSSDAASTGCW